MPTVIDGIDQSWSFASPSAAKAAGVTVVSMYLSHDPSKNMSVAKIRAYHGAGIDVLVNWEAMAGAPLNGAAQGRADATSAVAQLRALEAVLGKSAARLVVYLSCDRDVNAAQIAGPVAAYYRAARAVLHAAGYGVGAYGSARLVHYLAGAGITDAEWQTYAWSGGVLDPASDFYQYSNGRTLGGASVDFDRVIHRDKLGAWWPPTQEVDPMADLTPAQLDQISKAVWHRPLPGTNGDTHMAQTWLAWAQSSAAEAATVANDPKSGLAVRLATAQAQLAAALKAIAAVHAEIAAGKAATIHLAPLAVAGTLTIEEKTA